MPLSRKLYRYTKSKYAEDFVRNGNVYFNHARTFKNGNLTLAQQDNERIRSFNFEDAQQKPSLFDQHGRCLQLLQMDVFLTNGNLTPRDYFMLCWATEPIDRLYDEFDAEVCIQLKDPCEFHRRILNEIKAKFKVGGRYAAWDVKYFDPQLPPIVDDFLDYQFLKARQYSNQREFRMVLEVCHTSATQDNLVVKVGCLNDICRIYERGEKIADP